jgi:3-hydroxyisobutyrate dehydrogenase/2-hydroxy-3-oxopropionate reductase
MTLPESGARAAAERALAGTAVGLVGAGRMGSSMAVALAARGARIVVQNRTPARARELADRLGGASVATPAEAAAQADVLLVMVGDDAAVEAVFDGPDGATGSLRAGKVAVIMSTVLPDTVRRVGAPVRAAGAGILDAPVSGSVGLAEAGQLTIMVGGESADLERAKPVLDCLGSKVFHLGGLGAGSTMKLAVNSIVFSLNGALAEALVLAEKAGVDRATAYDLFGASVVGSPFGGYKRAAFLDPSAVPAAFSIALARKDLRLILELGERVGARMPQSEVNLGQLTEAEAELGGERDFSEVATHLRSPGTPG